MFGDKFRFYFCTIQPRLSKATAVMTFKQTLEVELTAVLPFPRANIQSMVETLRSLISVR